MTHDLCVPQKNTCLHPSYSGSDIENYSISLMEKITLLNMPKFIPLHQVFIEKLLLSHLTKDLAMAHTITTGSESCFLSEEQNTKLHSIDCLLRPFKGTASRERERWEEEKRYHKFSRGDAAEAHTDLVSKRNDLERKHAKWNRAGHRWPLTRASGKGGTGGSTMKNG